MSKLAAIGRAGLVIAVVVIIVIAAVGVSTYTSSTQKTSTSGLTTTGSTISASTTSSSLSVSRASTTVTSTLCTFPGQSMGLYLSVLSDSTSAPVVGANVTALYEFNGSCNGGFEPKQTTETFTTNGTESYFLEGLNNGNYSFGIDYSGHNYTLMSQLRPSVYTCVVVFLPSGTINVLFSPHNCPNQVQQNSTTSLTCSISGQPGGLQLRIVSDSTLQPIVGAKVTATSNPAYCSIFGGAPFPATTSSTLEFTTNGTLWYSLPTDNDGSYSFVVSYSNQNYAFNASLAPVSITCATLYIPSGMTNVTILEFQSSCPAFSNYSIAIVTEVIVQNTIFTFNACTVHSEVTNSTTFISPTVNASSTITTTGVWQFEFDNDSEPTLGHNDCDQRHNCRHQLWLKFGVRRWHALANIWDGTDRSCSSRRRSDHSGRGNWLCCKQS